MTAHSKPKTRRAESPLLLEPAADAVIEELEAWLGSRLPQRCQWISRLAEHARAVMTANARFRRRIEAAPDVEPLAVYMRHWLAAGLRRNHPAVFARLPYRYAVGTPPRTSHRRQGNIAGGKLG